MRIILLFIAVMLLLFALPALWVVVSSLPVPVAIFYAAPLLLCIAAARLIFRMAR